MTAPIPLHAYDDASGTYKPVAYACGKCKTVAASPAQYIGEDADAAARQSASEHCGPWFCACGKERPTRHDLVCQTCRRAESDKREAERRAGYLAKAKRVPLDEYEGDVFYDEDASEYLTRDEVLDRIAEGEVPGLLFGTTETGFTLDASEIITAEFESGDHHEDASEQLDYGATDALQEALDAWCAEYAAKVITSWPDHSVIVELPTRSEEGDEEGADET